MGSESRWLIPKNGKCPNKVQTLCLPLRRSEKSGQTLFGGQNLFANDVESGHNENLPNMSHRRGLEPQHCVRIPARQTITSTKGCQHGTYRHACCKGVANLSSAKMGADACMLWEGPSNLLVFLAISLEANLKQGTLAKRQACVPSHGPSFSWPKQTGGWVHLDGLIARNA